MKGLDLMNHPLVQEAAKFAALKHAEVGQLRKYTSQPYIVHPAQVAAMVSQCDDATTVMVAAAYLHDVIEDTECTMRELISKFPIGVCDLVGWLTDPIWEGVQPPRAERKQKCLEQLRNAPKEAKTIKICDLISNTATIATYADSKYALMYLHEKRRLLDEALFDGDEKMWQKASLITDKSIERLENEP